MLLLANGLLQWSLFTSVGLLDIMHTWHRYCIRWIHSERFTTTRHNSDKRLLRTSAHRTKRLQNNLGGRKDLCFSFKWSYCYARIISRDDVVHYKRYNGKWKDEDKVIQMRSLNQMCLLSVWHTIFLVIKNLCCQLSETQTVDGWNNDWRAVFKCIG